MIVIVNHQSGTELYSATAINFLGTEQVLQRHSFTAIRTEHRQSWLNSKLQPLCLNVVLPVNHRIL